ncbi:MAG: GlcNAc-PI de-N-acetylase [Frankiales bacterium]|nr:GlcNAc-PI de-N-acetylase [Frankiales bacterium]
MTGPTAGSDGIGRLRWQAAASVVKPLIVQAWRRELRRRAVDETASAAQRSCLVLAPHPDDETLGAGSLIARKRGAGTRVRVVIVTDGRGSHASELIGPRALAAIRRAESRRACGALGVDPADVVHLDLPEGGIASRIGEVQDAVTAEVERWEPDDVLVTSGLDWHEDHRALARAARLAVPGSSGPRLLEYPVWCWADGPWSVRPGRSLRQAARALVAEPVTTARSAHPVAVRAGQRHLEAKRAALAEYRSQTTNLTGEPDWAVMDEAFLSAFLRPEELFLTPPTGRTTVSAWSAP